MSSNPVVGIIAEYNPFHNGHAYQIARIRALLPDAALVAVMSGSFTQRGEPTVLDQWQRAALAIENGIDLVIELPYAFSCRSAQHFATGGIRLLAALGCVTHLAFGAETDDLPLLTQLAEASELQAVKEDLHQRLKEGRSYAAAFAGAVAQRCSCPPSILRQPNNILAIEYLRARTHFAPKLHPLLIHREGAAYHDESIVSNIASASAIRCTLSRLLSQQDPSPSWQELTSVLPDSVWEALHSSVPLHFPRQAFLYRSLLTISAPSSASAKVWSIAFCAPHVSRETGRTCWGSWGPAAIPPAASRASCFTCSSTSKKRTLPASMAMVHPICACSP